MQGNLRNVVCSFAHYFSQEAGGGVGGGGLTVARKLASQKVIMEDFEQGIDMIRSMF